MTIKNNPADDVISIIVPCFNEESVLPAFYSAVSDAASSIEGAVCEFLCKMLKDLCRSVRTSVIYKKKEQIYNLIQQLQYQQVLELII